jgi:hypothetical protein
MTMKFIGALAAATLLVTPLAANAQSHGGHGGGGGHGGYGGRGAASYGHGGYGRGGYGGYGFRGGGFYPYFGFGLGFALAADPWFWGYPGYYGWYDGPYWDDYYGPTPLPPPPPGANVAPPPAACGSWVWHADQGRYQWVATPCGLPAPPPGQAAPPPGS